MKWIVGAIIVLLLAGGIFTGTDWRIWPRYLASPEDPVSSVDWYSPFEIVGSGAGSDLKVASDNERTITGDALEKAAQHAWDFDSYSFLVSHRNTVQWEQYGETFSKTSLFDSQSMHKPIVIFLLGIALDEGAIGSIEDEVGAYLDEWENDERSEITIRDLLYMESGLFQPPYEQSPFNKAMQAFLTGHLDELALSLPLENPPGTKFDFHYLSTQLLSLVIERATGRRYADYLRDKIWEPIGGGDARVRLDRPQGTAQTFCCIQMTARGWLRFGQLLLNRGQWDGLQVIPESWIDKVLTPSRNPNFGMHVWLGAPFSGERRFSETRARAAIPVSAPFDAPDVFFLEGRGGQRVYVVPSQDLVVVRNGHVRMDWDDPSFLNLILAGIKQPKNRDENIGARTPGAAPSEPFDLGAAPPAPDYELDTSWAARPDLDDAADILPAGKSDGQAGAKVDAFYIHPTTYYGVENWNAPLEAEIVNTQTDVVIKGQAGAFNGCCAVYAPRYRQAAIAAVGDRTGSGMKAYDLAFQDVKAAFNWFLNKTDGRPFILAGHSQGTFHAQRLLSEIIVPNDLNKRMVAAYLVGVGVPLAMYEEDWSVLHPCKDEIDTRCVITWNTFSPGADTSMFNTGLKMRFDDLMTRTGNEKIQCTNPITWNDEDGAGPAELNQGAVYPGAPGETLGPVESGAIGAACVTGALMLSNEPGEPFSTLAFGAGNYHLADYALFYMNIRDNAMKRTSRYLGNLK